MIRPSPEVLELRDEELIKRLMALPESAMGYQKVSLKLKNGEVTEVGVYNCQFVILPRGRKSLAESDIIEINKVK